MDEGDDGWKTFLRVGTGGPMFPIAPDIFRLSSSDGHLTLRLILAFYSPDSFESRLSLRVLASSRPHASAESLEIIF
jgi:hypothetical protein